MYAGSTPALSTIPFTNKQPGTVTGPGFGVQIMTIHNIKYYENLPFSEYLKLPGYSYSTLKNNGVPFGAPTAKMTTGTAVHNYLLEPHLFDHSNTKAKKLALALKPVIGPMLKHLEAELSFTADMEHEGFVMPYRGRADLAMRGRLVIDLKYTEMDVRKAIDFFGYQHPITGYMSGCLARSGFVVSINPKTEATQVVSINPTHDFWNEMILKFGWPK